MTDYSLQNKIALITGASRNIGIGAAIAREFARAGADVFITTFHPYDAEQPWGSRAAETEALLTELRGHGVRAEALDIDQRDPTAPPRIFEAVEAALGPLDILVNNAAYSTRDGIDQLTAEILDNHYAVNVRGMALLCAEFARHWQKTSGGRIINLSSGQGVGPMPGELAYVASKGAVEAFTITLSAELAGRGITVNAIDPGVTDTGWLSPEMHAEWSARAPFGRIGLPQDAARLVRFLASDEAGWITGQVIHSRGGL